MKTHQSILIILSLIFLASCGTKGSETTLQVTSNFAATNSLFQGGLIVTGKDNSGNNFTLPMDFASGSSSAIKMNLKKGVWKFTAIGWDGGSDGKFTGNQMCDFQSVDLSQDAQTVSLSLSTAKCQTYATETSTISTLNAFHYNPLRFVTCGTFYTLSGSVVGATTDHEYCTPTANNVDPHYRKYAWSIKIEIPKIDHGVESPGISECVYLSAASGVFPAVKKIPPHMPVKITLFDFAGCPSNPDNFITTYHFKDGIRGSYSDFDSFHKVESTVQTLFLPTNKIQRGKNNFLSLMPSIKCTIDSTDKSCMPLPTLSGVDRLIGYNQEFLLLDYVDPTTQLCSNLVITGPTVTAPDTGLETFNPATQCRIQDNKLFVTLKFHPMTFSAVGRSITISGTGFTSTTMSLYDVSWKNFLSFGYETLGFPQLVSPQVKASFPYLFKDDEDDRSLGEISSAAEAFTPSGALAVLGNTTCAAGVNTSKIASFMDDGIFETYRIILSDSNTAIPKFICQDQTLGVPCADTFTKKVIIQKKRAAEPVFDNESIMHFKCSEKIGMVENLHIENTDIFERNLIYWNTDNINSARVESYTSDNFLSPTNQRHIRNTITRIEKNGANSVKVSSSDYSRNFFASQYRSRIYLQQIHLDVSGKTLHMVSDFPEDVSTIPDNMFNGMHDSNFNNPFIKFFNNPSPNGAWKIKGGVLGPCLDPNITLGLTASLVNETTGQIIPYSSLIDADCRGFTSISASINNSGRGIIAAHYSDSAGSKIKIFIFDGTTWYVHSPVITSVFLSHNIKAHMYEDNTPLLIWIESNSNATFNSLVKSVWNKTDYAQTGTKSNLIEGSATVQSVEHFDGVANSSGQFQYIAASTSAGNLSRFFSGFVNNGLADTVDEMTDFATSVTTAAPQSITSSMKSGYVMFYYTFWNGVANKTKPFKVLSDRTYNLAYPEIDRGYHMSFDNCYNRGPVMVQETTCTPVQGSDISAIRPMITVNPQSLKPSVFDSAFTPPAVFRGQN